VAVPYASLQVAPDRQPRQHLTTQFFTGRMPFLRQSCHPTNSINAIKARALKASFAPYNQASNQYTVSMAHLSPYSKQQLDRFNRFCTAHSCNQQTDKYIHTDHRRYDANEEK